MEFLGEGGGGGEAAGWVFLQALQAERVEVGGDLAVELRRRRQVRIQNLLHEQLLVSLGAEGAFAGQQLEQNHPHGPSVRAAIDGVAVLPLLRRHVRGGTEQLTRWRHHVLGLGVTLGHAEVHHSRQAIRTDQNVRGLQVSCTMPAS